MLRGSGHRGLVAIKVNPSIIRPLANVAKEEILTYAKKHKIKWREDATNQDETYLRNYIRKNTMPALTDKKRVLMVNNIEKIADIIAEKDHLIATLSQDISQNNKIIRGKYIMLPQEVRRELVVYWLRNYGVSNFEKNNIEKIDMVFKTGKPNTAYPVKRGLWLKLERNTGQFETRV
jgi:tRNA(Ile)-lysidine synthase TilS/MesJ